MLASLKDELSSQEIEYLRPNKYGSVKFDDEKWMQYNMASVCELIQQWNIQSGLFLRNSSAPNFFKEIKHLHFENMKKICLSNNKIQSIESIVRISTPNLKFLQLSQNYITNLNSLKKLKSYRLVSIILTHNFITDEEYPIVDLNLANLSWIQLDWSSKDSIVYQNINWITKFSTFKLDNLWIMSENRIISLPVVKSLEQKWIRLKVKHQN